LLLHTPGALTGQAGLRGDAKRTTAITRRANQLKSNGTIEEFERIFHGVKDPLVI
jgi:hypothetical protein